MTYYHLDSGTFMSNKKQPAGDGSVSNSGNGTGDHCHHKLHHDVTHARTSGEQLFGGNNAGSSGEQLFGGTNAHKHKELAITPAQYGHGDSRFLPIPETRDLYKYSGTESKLDPHKSVADNIQSGAFKSRDAGDKPGDHPHLKPGETPKISVQYKDQDSNAHQAKPDFVVHKDGTVEVTHNPKRPLTARFATTSSFKSNATKAMSTSQRPNNRRLWTTSLNTRGNASKTKIPTASKTSLSKTAATSSK